MVKTILITGSTGFLGSWLVNEYAKKYNVIALKRNLSDVSRIQESMDNIKCYNVDNINLDTIFQKNKIDIVIHTATNYGFEGSKPSEVIESNVLFPLRLLELSVENNVKVFINTDSFYNTGNIYYSYLKYYAYSKNHFSDLLKSFADKIKIVNMKIGIIFGPGDNKNKFTVQMIHRMLKDETSIDLTEGSQKRDFLYISEAVRIYDIILKTLDKLKENYSEIDLGYEEPMTIKDYLKLIHKHCNSSSILNFGALPIREGEIMNPKADVSQIIAFGWKPIISQEEGLQLTINKEREYLNMR